MSADEMDAAVELREVLEGQIRLCTARARQLDRYIFNWDEDSKEKKALFAEIERTLKICELVQKVLTRMRKEEGEAACRGSCQTFAVTMLGVNLRSMRRGRDADPPGHVTRPPDAAGPAETPEAGGPADDGRRGHEH